MLSRHIVSVRCLRHPMAKLRGTRSSVHHSPRLDGADDDDQRPNEHIAKWLGTVSQKKWRKHEPGAAKNSTRTPKRLSWYLRHNAPRRGDDHESKDDIVPHLHRDVSK